MYPEEQLIKGIVIYNLNPHQMAWNAIDLGTLLPALSG